MQSTPARRGRLVFYEGEAELLRRLDPRSPYCVQAYHPPLLRRAYVAPPARRWLPDGVATFMASRARRREDHKSPRRVQGVPYLLSIYDWRSSDAPIVSHRRSSLSPPPPRWPGAAREHTRHDRILPPLLVLRVPPVFTLHSIIERNLSYVMYMLSLSISDSLHTSLPCKTSWNQGAIDLGVTFFGHPFLCHPPLFLVDRRLAREVSGHMRRRQGWTGKTDIVRLFLKPGTSPDASRPRRSTSAGWMRTRSTLSTPPPAATRRRFGHILNQALTNLRAHVESCGAAFPLSATARGNALIVAAPLDKTFSHACTTRHVCIHMGIHILTCTSHQCRVA
jgi:hypothetical protein